MLEKIGHIKNPLTVIALFAGIAEVSGTIVLPLLEKDVQSTYVWFLMAFPALLVGLFFLTLWTCHQVLYAPSDFRDDSLFRDILAPSSLRQVEAKLSDEVEEALDTQEEAPPVEANASPVLDVEHPEPKSSFVDKPATPGVYRHHSQAELKRKIQISEQLAISQLESELGASFQRDVRLKAMPEVALDGVAVLSEKVVLVEVKYTRAATYRGVTFERILDKADLFYKQLSVSQRAKFEFVFAFVYDIGVAERIKSLNNEILRGRALKYSFPTVIRDFSMVSYGPEEG